MTREEARKVLNRLPINYLGLKAEEANRIDEAVSMAISALAQTNNEPLNVEQLQEMIGEPVWVEYSNGARQWHIVKDVLDYAGILAIRWKDGGLESIQDYGKTWLAYRRPPEGEVDT